jgi:hypothetical protein
MFPYFPYENCHHSGETPTHPSRPKRLRCDEGGLQQVEVPEAIDLPWMLIVNNLLIAGGCS